MRTGGPTPADSAHNGTESAPFPVRLTENGLTADAGIPVQLKVSGGTAETSLLRKGRPWNLFRPVPGSRKKTEQERIPYIVYIALGGRFFC